MRSLSLGVLMARIREDLKGSVMVAGHILMAGDEVPAGAKVDKSLLAPARRRKGATDGDVGNPG